MTNDALASDQSPAEVLAGAPKGPSGILPSPEVKRSSTRALATRIRSYVLAMILSCFLQGAFLANAISREDSLWWAIWVGVLVIALVLIGIAAVRVTPLSREYRSRTWGER